jgi:hypothetical protein
MNMRVKFQVKWLCKSWASFSPPLKERLKYNSADIYNRMGTIEGTRSPSNPKTTFHQLYSHVTSRFLRTFVVLRNSPTHVVPQTLLVVPQILVSLSLSLSQPSLYTSSSVSLSATNYYYMNPAQLTFFYFFLGLNPMNL